MTLISINIHDEDIEYLDSRGINRSGFMRQAITAHKEQRFEYDYIKKSNSNANKRKD